MGYPAFGSTRLDPRVTAPTPAPEGQDSVGDSLRKGFSSGVDTLGANVAQIGGLGAEALGADGVSRSLYRGAKSLRDQAQFDAPQINSLDQVDGVGNALRWGAGQLGAMAPIAAGAVAGTLATGNPITGGALAMGLPEAGDIAYRQTEDPEAMQAGAGERLGRAVVGGAASGAVQAVGPGMFVGKVAKGAGSELLKKGTKQIIGENLAHGVGVNAGAGAGSEVIKQLATNQDKPLDTAAVGDTALAGGVLGLPFGAAGAGVDLAKAGPAKSWIGAKKAVQGGLESAQGALDSAKDALTPASSPTDVVSKLREFTKPVGDMTDTILNSESADGLKDFTGKTLDQAKEMLKERGAKFTEYLGPKIDSLMERADVSDERKQQLADLRTNIGDQASQIKAATILKAQEAADYAKPKIDAAYEKVSGAFKKLFPGDDSAKKSDDHSGMNALIFDTIGPMIKEAKPELLEDPATTQKLGSTLRMFMTAAAEGKDLRVAGIHNAITDLLGPDLAHDVLNAAHEFATGGDQTKQANYFKHLTESVQDKTDMDGLETVITKNLSTEAPQRTGVTQNPRELAKFLRSWARGDLAEGKPKERVQFEDQAVQKFLEEHFGTKAKKVLDAVQKDVENERGKQKANPGVEDTEFGTTSEQDTNVAYHGVKDIGDTPKLYESDAAVKARGDVSQHGSAVEQAIKKLKAENPDMNVSFVKLADYAKAHSLDAEQVARLAEGKDPSQVGFIKKERIKSDDSLEEHQLRAMRGKIQSTKHPDAIGVEGRSDNYAYDSRRIANVMRKAAGTERSDFEDAHGFAGQLAQKFAEGVAKLTQHEGRNLKVRDDHVIGRVGGKDFTWGEGRNLLADKPRLRTDADKRNDAQRDTVEQLRKAAETAQKDRALSKDEKKAAWREYYRESGKADFRRDAELTSEGRTADLESRLAKAVLKRDDEMKAANIKSVDHPAISELQTKIDDLREKLRDAKFEDWYSSEDGVHAREGRRESSPTEDVVQRAGKDFSQNDMEQANYNPAKDHSTKDVPLFSPIDGALTDNGKDVLRMKLDRMRSSAVASTRELVPKIEALSKIADELSDAERKNLNVAVYADVKTIKVLGRVVNEMYDKHLGSDKYPDGGWQSVDAQHQREADAARGSKGEDSLESTLAKHQKYLDEPPENYSTDRAREIAEWAGRQEERLKKEASKLEAEGGDEYDRLDDLRFKARLLREKAQQIIQSDLDGAEADRRNGTNLFGGNPDPKAVAAKKAALLEKAASGDKSLTKELSESTDAKGLQRAVEALADAGPSKALDAANKRLGELVQDPNTAYGLQTKKYNLEKVRQFPDRKGEVLREKVQGIMDGMSESDLDTLQNDRVGKFEYPKMPSALKEYFSDWLHDYGPGEAGMSHERIHETYREYFEHVADVDNGWDHEQIVLAQAALDDKLGPRRDATAATNTSPLTSKGRKQILDYLNRATPWVQAEFPFLQHAGEFTKEFGQAIVRVSSHALNPTSVAYHESLHAFFQHLKDNSNSEVSRVVMDAASSPAVTSQLSKLLSHSPEALAQLSNAEERAAYMYQFWADGKLNIGEKATTLFGKITEALRKVLGIWSNDERALHIMEYFHSGEYAQNADKPSAVRAALMEKGRNAAVDHMHRMGENFMEMGDALWGAGSARLRDSQSEALHELADLVKRRGTDAGEDRGFIPAARLKRTEFITQLANGLAGMDESVMHETLEALQNGTKPTSPEARAAHAAVRKVLDDVFDYLHQAGVNTGDLGYGKDYFPRHWDTNYLSKHEAEFMDMARKYSQWNDPQDTYNKLIANDGAELKVVDRPGMQANKKRVLSFISDADAAPFMSKNLPEIMNGYITQATRRAEWARRFTDDSSKIEELLTRAQKEGASKKEIEHAKDFVAGVNGTLGDDLNPTLRRYMGNMIVYQNIRLLPLAIFSSVVDPMGVMVRGGSVRNAWDTFKRGIREVPAGLKGEQVKDHWTEMAQTLGVIDDASLQHALGSLYTQGMVGGTARKINDAFFRFNLMEQFNQSMRVGATESALQFIAKHGDGKASIHSARWMTELGLRHGDVRMVNGRPAISEAEGLTAAQAARVKMAVNQWVDGAVLRPDAADKPTWMNDPHYMLLSHLKQFVYAFHHTILDRVIHEAKHQNYAPAVALSSYVPVMIAADMLKGLIQGGGSEPDWKKGWGASDYLENGVERAGLFGVGQFGVDTLKGNFGSISGPTLGQFAEGFEVLDGAKQFKPFAIHSLPANQLYAGTLHAGVEDPKFAE